jgi:CheY-like chemotaxis protein
MAVDLGAVPPGRSRRVRVLLVDDDASVRAVIGRFLESAGYDLLTASDGIEALAVVEPHTPLDLLVTDLQLPGLSGTEVARRFRQSRPRLPILYLSGDLDRERGSAVADAILMQKPVNRRDFLDAVSRCCHGRCAAGS